MVEGSLEILRNDTTSQIARKKVAEKFTITVYEQHHMGNINRVSGSHALT